jgi:hypothetical protein
MKGFTFQTTRHIVSELGAAAQIGALMKGPREVAVRIYEAAP